MILRARLVCVCRMWNAFFRLALPVRCFFLFRCILLYFSFLFSFILARLNGSVLCVCRLVSIKGCVSLYTHIDAMDAGWIVWKPENYKKTRLTMLIHSLCSPFPSIVARREKKLCVKRRCRHLKWNFHSIPLCTYANSHTRSYLIQKVSKFWVSIFLFDIIVVVVAVIGILYLACVRFFLSFFVFIRFALFCLMVNIFFALCLSFAPFRPV